ncbi:Hypothetical protein FKW44_025393 [Caligus rogercresseyi]|uniref:Uncharacterized protein n=1 Tax=Caligus rogercresseyi TaxID=217165 RepID=A0A7T8JTJ5_CALRO|nr:Hypothetical protein FKW44_025393 [Caligus rogercresseyi]
MEGPLPWEADERLEEVGERERERNDTERQEGKENDTLRERESLLFLAGTEKKRIGLLGCIAWKESAVEDFFSYACCFFFY